MDTTEGVSTKSESLCTRMHGDEVPANKVLASGTEKEDERADVELNRKDAIAAELQSSTPITLSTIIRWCQWSFEVTPERTHVSSGSWLNAQPHRAVACQKSGTIYLGSTQGCKHAKCLLEGLPRWALSGDCS